MAELWLKFTDPDGKQRRVLVDKDRFTIGRHSESDLCIVDGRLSREHALIERFGYVFSLSDQGSSNGTELNDQKLSAAAALSDGDKISFGGFDAAAEITTGETAKEDPKENEPVAAPAAAPLPPAPAPPPPPDTGIPNAVFIAAPILALFVIAVIGIVLYLGSGKPTVVSGGPRDYDDPPRNRKNVDVSPTKDKPDGPEDITSPSPANTSGIPTPAPSVANEGIAKTEKNASAFLRKIAQNDPRAFVIGEPANAVYSRIKSLSSSPAIAANIASARRNAAAIKSLAASKNLKPDLLAAAAIARLGSSSGDVLQTSRAMADTLDRLSTQLSSELGEECLVIIAAYDQGEAGDFMKMRNMLQDLATKMPDLARDIRTIWFLKKQGKITDAEYDMAVRFLAVGTIAQNPKDFGVNAEALTF